jgi:signal transduction histidine kinase
MTGSLRQADQAKTAFVSDVSHELRTPLTVIKGAIETLQDGAIDDHEARDTFLSSMSRETERLIRLVNDLLVLTRADAGVLNLHMQPVDLTQAALERCGLMEQRAAQRGVRLIVSEMPGTGRCTVDADPDRLAQVLDNLLDNSLRYSPENNEVRIGIFSENGRVACRVQDCGPGIPPEHLPLIFERFYRADPARDRAQGGSGLGLAIVRGLVLAMGGDVEASSSPGEGATLVFWLPLVKS